MTGDGTISPGAYGPTPTDDVEPTIMDLIDHAQAGEDLTPEQWARVRAAWATLDAVEAAEPDE